MGIAAQQPGTQTPALNQLQNLAAAQRWPELARLLSPVPNRTADMDYYLGLAQAHTGHNDEAARTFEIGSRLAPRDARFPEELAGLAFEQKRYPRAARLLRHAVKLAPDDKYANNFLATVYYLEGNLEGALQYWNRLGKPNIASVREQPQPLVSPALLDHAFAFSPAATLRLPQFYLTNARVRALGIFPQYHFDLDALPDGNFDVVFRSRELDGFGGGKWEAAVLVLRGLPFQQVNPAYYNFRHEAINFDSMFRWDAQKRRIFARASGPFQNGAMYRWNVAADLRDENWALRDSFMGPAPVLASMNLRREAAAFDLTSYGSGYINWSLGAELSHRDFRSAAPGLVLTPQMLSGGYELKQLTRDEAALLRVPGHRLALSGVAEAQAARLWSQPARAFEKLTGGLAWHWFPQAQGDDYETTQSIRAGHTFGQPPFDELFTLGLDQDNDLDLRAHIATRAGRKGSAPMGRDYFLENWETDKDLYSNGIVRVRFGPFFDIGHITDPGTILGSRKWLFDTGAEAKLRVLGATVAFIYGKDLRTGNNAFYAVPLGSGSTTGMDR
ncbi:MAG TPA: tetratricopeptide repeat protein [Terracidiphilus sp.]|nr:tetratricopeptide repeat protein [Terracidiphilus sp.]